MAESDKPAIISDGKRMRVVWVPADGSGDPSIYLVDRSSSTIKGHPTWKIFTSDFAEPIVRGSGEEPPRYIYLDDKACFLIYKARVYTHQELRNFWPFDFDHQGNIKTGRGNRGRPAYADSSFAEFAKGKLRGKNKWYEFSGEPAVGDYKPVRPVKKKTPTASEVDEEDSEVGSASDAAQALEDEQPDSSAPGAAFTATMSTAGTPLNMNTGHIYPPRPALRPVPRPTPTRPGPRTQALSLPPRGNTGSPYLNVPASMFRAAPRPTGGDLNYLLYTDASYSPASGDVDSVNDVAAATAPPAPINLGQFNPKRTLSEAFQRKDKQPAPSTPLRRPFVQPFEVSSSEGSPATPSPKRVNKGSGTAKATPTKLKPSSFGLDGANDDEDLFVPEGGHEIEEESLGVSSVHAEILRLKKQLKTSNDANTSLEQDKAALEAHVRVITAQRNHYRAVITQLLADNSVHQADLSERVIAFQKTAEKLAALSQAVQKEMKDSSEQIAPTRALCEGLGTVLDGPGKYMHKHGLDEEWRTMQEEARKMNERNGTRGSQQRSWNFS